MRYAKHKKQDKCCRIIRRCGGCGKKTVFTSAGKFRVNANGRRLDIWLICRCERCGHTWNVPVYERITPERLDPELYQRFMENDLPLAEQYARDRGFWKSRGCRLAKGQEK